MGNIEYSHQDEWSDDIGNYRPARSSYAHGFFKGRAGSSYICQRKGYHRHAAGENPLQDIRTGYGGCHLYGQLRDRIDRRQVQPGQKHRRKDGHQQSRPESASDFENVGDREADEDQLASQ